MPHSSDACKSYPTMLSRQNISPDETLPLFRRAPRRKRWPSCLGRKMLVDVLHSGGRELAGYHHQ